MAIIIYPNQEKLLNKRSELISKCRHEKKFSLKYYDSNDRGGGGGGGFIIYNP